MIQQASNMKGPGPNPSVPVRTCVIPLWVRTLSVGAFVGRVHREAPPQGCKTPMCSRVVDSLVYHPLSSLQSSRLETQDRNGVVRVRI